MCGEGGLWQGELSLSPVHEARKVLTRDVSQVRVVQHKQTRELYALKYINKSKCVKMRAVNNIIQERRLLEEVRPVSPPVYHPLLTAY